MVDIKIYKESEKLIEAYDILTEKINGISEQF